VEWHICFERPDWVKFKYHEDDHTISISDSAAVRTAGFQLDTPIADHMSKSLKHANKACLYLTLERQPENFLTHILFPCFITAAASFGAFLIGVENINDKLAISGGTILGITSLQFVASADMPKVPYATAATR
jgi:hypothetical protein